MVMRSFATRRTLLFFYYTKETYHSKPQYVVSKLERELATAQFAGAGRTPGEFTNFLEKPEWTMCRVVNKYAAAEEAKAGFNTAQWIFHDAEKIVRASELIVAIQRWVSSDASVSIKILAKKFDVSARTMLRIVHKDLRYTLHTIRVR